MRKWSAEHREQTREWARQTRAKSPEQSRASHSRWVERNKEYVKQTKHKYTVDHLEADLKRLDDWSKKNPERVNARQRARWKAIRADVLAGYGGKCVCCGETANEFLAIDHINGHGKEHRASIGAAFYSRLKRQGVPEGFRILCHNCNFARGRYGYCPHEHVITTN